MSSLIQSPFVRQSYPSVDNPIYSQDIVAANQAVLDMVETVAGLGASDFAIFSGLEYIQPISGGNYYTPGYFFFNGIWYFMPTNLEEGEYLKPNVTGIMNYTYEDAVIRPEYDVNFAQASASPSGSTIQFVGNMNFYRLDNKTLSQQVNNVVFLTTVVNVQQPTMPTTLVLTFANDQCIFNANTPTSGDFFIECDFTNAVPGTVVRLKVNFGAISALSIVVGAGQNIYLDSGDPTMAPNNLNILYFLYAGKNELGNDEASYTISQV